MKIAKNGDKNDKISEFRDQFRKYHEIYVNHN